MWWATPVAGERHSGSLTAALRIQSHEVHKSYHAVMSGNLGQTAITFVRPCLAVPVAVVPSVVWLVSCRSK